MWVAVHYFGRVFLLNRLVVATERVFLSCAAAPHYSFIIIMQLLHIYTINSSFFITLLLTLLPLQNSIILSTVKYTCSLIRLE